MMSDALQLSKARDCDYRTKSLIFGFVRIKSNEYEISQNIPDLICFIIIIYFINEECFDKPGKDIQISED